jgi:hypothetical protein
LHEADSVLDARYISTTIRETSAKAAQTMVHTANLTWVSSDSCEGAG